MITIVLHLLRLLPSLFGGHRQLALENLALRQQLAIYKRTAPRPPLHTMERLFWVGLARAWTGWKQPLIIVTPDTVLHWQRRRLREYWAQLSGRPTGGRPPVGLEIATLVRRMAAANPLGGAPRIHGELMKLGIDFFTVPTAQLRVLFVLVVLAHHRRRVLHFNVTAHPTAAWTAQQIVDTFPDDTACPSPKPRPSDK